MFICVHLWFLFRPRWRTWAYERLRGVFEDNLRMTLPVRLQRFAQYSLWLASFCCLAALSVTSLSPSRSPGEKFSSLYNLPMYSAFFSWLYCRLRENTKFSVVTIVLDLTVVGLAASRFFGPIIPSSGHALFLSYSLLTTNSRLYRIIAAILLALTIALKLSWGDYSSWLYGILIGLLFFAVYKRSSA